jgi:hypothetical protein
VRAARPFEPLLVGDFTVTAVPAVDGYGAPQVSWVVDGGGRRQGADAERSGDEQSGESSHPFPIGSPPADQQRRVRMIR